jgi:glycosyltransferase involved in cell wall biosynthesis
MESTSSNAGNYDPSDTSRSDKGSQLDEKDHQEAARDSHMLITVAICTYRRPDRVDCALASLSRQVGRLPEWEILVVENGAEPTPAMAAICQKYMPQLPLRQILEPSVGLSHARNAAVREAGGEYVAYLDDDAEADAGWLVLLAACCREYEPDFCGGPSYPLYRAPKPSWFLDAYGTANFYGDQPRWLARSEWLGGMNFVVKRALCEKLGGFRIDLGMSGTKTAYGEETELMMRAWAANPQLKVRYLPQASVLHEVRPEKMTIRWKMISAWAGGKSAVIVYPMTRTRAALGLLASALRLVVAVVRAAPCFRRDESRRLLWQQWLFESFRIWLWNFSRSLHAIFGRR